MSLSEPAEAELLVSESLRTSEQLNDLAAALASAQGEMGHAVKSSDNPFFKSSYAGLDAIVDVVRAPFAKHEIAFVQAPFRRNGSVGVCTRIIHSSGQWIECSVEADAKDSGPQAIGSVITYLRRYALSAVAGVASEDDDGESAEGRSKNKPASKQAAEKKARPATNKPNTITQDHANKLWKKAMVRAEETGATREQIMRDVLAALDVAGTPEIPAKEFERVMGMIDEWDPTLEVPLEVPEGEEF